MFCGITNDRKKDKTNECLADMCGFDERVDAIDEVFGADGYGDCDNDKDTGCGLGTYSWFFELTAVAGGLVFGVEEVGMRAKLEDNIQHIEY